ncbi:MAG: endolytic transglycosylase MltG [bacterium]
MRILKYLVAAAFISVLSALGLFVYFDSPPGGGGGSGVFTVEPGQSAASVGEALQREGFIRSAFLFKLVIVARGKPGTIRAGRYRLSPFMSTRRIIEQLTSGAAEIPRVSVTVPEGFTAREIAARMDRAGLCRADRWMEIARAPELYGVDTHTHRLGTLEGFLFPDTYLFDAERPCEVYVQRMVDRFFEVFTEGHARRASEKGFSLVEVVTLASMIEEEAKLDGERALIAGVLTNRLKKGMLLQCDATVQYALPARKKRLLYKDLETDSPYNTYLHKGLPPGPICSPGARSLAAALEPAHTPYLYYVARADGSHAFSATAPEHERAVIEARRGWRDAGARSRGGAAR